MFEDLEWDAEMVPGVKLGFHIAQILFGFACFCLEIAVFRGEGATVSGQNGWPFAVVSRLARTSGDSRLTEPLSSASCQYQPGST